MNNVRKRGGAFLITMKHVFVVPSRFLLVWVCKDKSLSIKFPVLNHHGGSHGLRGCQMLCKTFASSQRKEGKDGVLDGRSWRRDR